MGAVSCMERDCVCLPLAVQKETVLWVLLAVWKENELWVLLAV